MNAQEIEAARKVFAEIDRIVKDRDAAICERDGARADAKCLEEQARAWIEERCDLYNEIAKLRAALAARPVVAWPEAQKLHKALEDAAPFDPALVDPSAWSNKPRQCAFAEAARDFLASKPPSRPAPAERPVDRELAEAFAAWDNRPEVDIAIYSPETQRMIRAGRAWLAAPRAPVADDAVIGLTPLIEAYTRGYQAGHNRTVEGVFIPVEYSDVTYFEDTVLEAIDHGAISVKLPNPADDAYTKAAVRLAEGFVEDAIQLPEFLPSADAFRALYASRHASGKGEAEAPGVTPPDDVIQLASLKPAAAPARVVYVHEDGNGVAILSTNGKAWYSPVIGTLSLTPVAEESR